MNGILYKYKGNQENIIIPDSVKNISNFAFENCCNIRNIIIPDSVVNIGIHAFADCKNLERVTISGSIEYIERATFGNCENLKSIELPESITDIHDDAFNNCTNLTYLTININKVKINLSDRGNMNIIKTMNNILSLVRNKDFSVRLDLRIKYKLIIDYFFVMGDNDTKYYIKKNFTKIMKQCIENNDIDRINKILKNTGFVTKRNINHFISYSAENNKYEIQNILLDYKNK